MLDVLALVYLIGFLFAYWLLWSLRNLLFLDEKLCQRSVCVFLCYSLLLLLFQSLLLLFLLFSLLCLRVALLLLSSITSVRNAILRLCLLIFTLALFGRLVLFLRLFFLLFNFLNVLFDFFLNLTFLFNHWLFLLLLLRQDWLFDNSRYLNNIFRLSSLDLLHIIVELFLFFGVVTIMLKRRHYSLWISFIDLIVILKVLRQTFRRSGIKPIVFSPFVNLINIKIFF